MRRLAQASLVANYMMKILRCASLDEWLESSSTAAVFAEMVLNALVSGAAADSSALWADADGSLAATKCLMYHSLSIFGNIVCMPGADKKIEQVLV